MGPGSNELLAEDGPPFSALEPKVRGAIAGSDHLTSALDEPLRTLTFEPERALAVRFMHWGGGDLDGPRPDHPRRAALELFTTDGPTTSTRCPRHRPRLRRQQSFPVTPRLPMPCDPRQPARLRQARPPRRSWAKSTSS